MLSYHMHKNKVMCLISPVCLGAVCLSEPHHCPWSVRTQLAILLFILALIRLCLAGIPAPITHINIVIPLRALLLERKVHTQGLASMSCHTVAMVRPQILASISLAHPFLGTVTSSLQRVYSVNQLFTDVSFI